MLHGDYPNQKPAYIRVKIRLTPLYLLGYHKMANDILKKCPQKRDIE